jgi:hypothetical protein
MSQPARAVLSYATPRSLRRARNPLRTQIITDDTLPCLHFIEVSAERKKDALWGIAFLALTLVLIGSMAGSEWRRVATWGVRQGRVGQALFLTSFCLAQIGAILYVIQKIWTRTIIAVRDTELWLDVQAPFGANLRRWERAEVDGIEAWTTDEGDRHVQSLAELHIRPRQGATVKVLRNYSRGQLVPIALALDAELKRTYHSDAPPTKPW